MGPPAMSPISARIAGARLHADAASPRRVDLRRSGELLALVTTPRRLTDDRPDQRAFQAATPADRKSTRLNSSHSQISYAVFCLKKKKKKTTTQYLANRYGTDD